MNIVLLNPARGGAAAHSFSSTERIDITQELVRQFYADPAVAQGTLLEYEQAVARLDRSENLNAPQRAMLSAKLLSAFYTGWQVQNIHHGVIHDIVLRYSHVVFSNAKSVVAVTDRAVESLVLGTKFISGLVGIPDASSPMRDQLRHLSATTFAQYSPIQQHGFELAEAYWACVQDTWAGMPESDRQRTIERLRPMVLNWATAANAYGHLFQDYGWTNTCFPPTANSFSSTLTNFEHAMEYGIMVQGSLGAIYGSR